MRKLFRSSKVIGKKPTGFQYMNVWINSWSSADVKVLIIKRDNPLEEPQITDRGWTVVTQSRYMSWLRNIGHWKKVVMKTGIWASFKTTKNK